MMYKSIKVFIYMFVPSIFLGIWDTISVLFATDGGNGHVQSLILACTLNIIVFLTFMIGLVSAIK